MKHLSRILPAVAVISVIGGAIYYVRSQAAERPTLATIEKAAVPSQGNLVPPSDRYASQSASN